MAFRCGCSRLVHPSLAYSVYSKTLTAAVQRFEGPVLVKFGNNRLGGVDESKDAVNGRKS